ncbi:peptidylprolyl isomerase [Streptomyces indicus]|uniref:Peptidyl-prolyl cis-trans isomerase n=1 Tax=Streptomyces indicus TaxID=417292 RepID=A0A1G8XF31_9ACTN|nr:peptidylprolyl isomerase [Streptomyces indicus]SDJ89036.1 peptidyl-prolyl cis-trans isomerase B (cyclophilin B) [Streptomyces indicus]
MVSSEQRRKQLAREKFLRQQQRREAARRKTRQRNAIIASTLVVVLAAGGGAWAAGAFKGDGKSDKTDTAAGSTPSEQPTPKESPAPKMAIDKKAKYTFDIKTNEGDISIAMDAAKTPETVNSFKHLADKGYFDNTKCHRLTTQGIYVLQCGDPEGTGAGGPGYSIPDENLDGLGKAGKDGSVTYPAGTVAMANAGPNTGGSQFFLVYKDSKLPPAYTPFGEMDEAGLKLVEKVGKAGVAEGSQSPGDGAPKKAVTLEKATVKKS